MGIAAMTVTANEVTECTKDNNEDKARQSKTERDEGDGGRLGKMKGD